MDPVFDEGSPEVAAGEGEPSQRTTSIGDHSDWLACVKDTMATLGRRWLPPILLELSDGPLRFGELEHRVQGVTPKVLSQTLRTMRADGLIDVDVVLDCPRAPAQAYTITALGRCLIELLQAVELWGTEHLGEITDARNRWDASDGGGSLSPR